MQKTLKLKLYPSNKQIQQIESTLGACRFVYNQYISARFELYTNNKKSNISAYDFIKNQYKELKHGECEWLKETNAQSHQNSIITAEKAYKSFLKNIKKTNKHRKENGKKVKFHPRFKSKHNDVQSYYVSGQSIKISQNEDGKYNIKLPKLGAIKYRGNIPNNFEHHDSRVVKRYGEYYLYLVVTISDIKHTKSNPVSISIDLGVKYYATFLIYGYGKPYKNIVMHNMVNHFLKYDRVKMLTERKTKLHQIISYKIETNKKNKSNHPYTSNNIMKLRRKIQSIDKQIQDIRDNMMYQFINVLVKTKPEHIIMEDLNVQKMLNRIPYDGKKKLRNRISKSGFYLFRQRMETKCNEYGIDLIFANKYFASSKTCSQCGYKNNDLTLKDRVYSCPKCGLEIDRDLNACVNLMKNCLRVSG